eukprot:1084932-Pelagomonas_calceolata.AAC.3
MAFSRGTTLRMAPCSVSSKSDPRQMVQAGMPQQEQEMELRAEAASANAPAVMSVEISAQATHGLKGGCRELADKSGGEEAMSIDETSGEEDDYGGTDGGRQGLGGTQRSCRMTVDTVCWPGLVSIRILLVILVGLLPVALQ